MFDARIGEKSGGPPHTGAENGGGPQSLVSSVGEPRTHGKGGGGGGPHTGKKTGAPTHWKKEWGGRLPASLLSFKLLLECRESKFPVTSCEGGQTRQGGYRTLEPPLVDEMLAKPALDQVSQQGMQFQKEKTACKRHEELRRKSKTYHPSWICECEGPRPSKIFAACGELELFFF